MYARQAISCPLALIATCNSTLHSSRGLDFPVVLPYLPSLPTRGECDEKASESLARNLIYVAISRAMDKLKLFVIEEARERAAQELVGAMNGMGATGGA